jgi:hypothetical protein
VAGSTRDFEKTPAGSSRPGATDLEMNIAEKMKSFVAFPGQLAANVITRLRSFCGFPAQPDPAAAREMRVSKAYELLWRANKKTISVPPDIVAAIVAAHKDISNCPDEFNEIRFWDAYGELKSRIYFAPRTRNVYRLVLYFVLVVLLLSQIFYIAGDHVRSKVTDYDKQISELERRPDASEQKPSIDNLKKERTAYCQLGRDLIEIAGTVTYLPLRPLGFHRFFSVDRNERNLTATNEVDLITRSKLDTILVFFSSYWLPMLYGLLGACAFVLRQLCHGKDKLAYAHAARVHHSQRLNIGLLAGLAVGWFIKPGAGDASLVSLSPLALAFIAGYGSDLFFVALDKIVQAFAAAPAGQADRKHDENEKPGGQKTGEHATQPSAGARPSSSIQTEKNTVEQIASASPPIADMDGHGRSRPTNSDQRLTPAREL